MSRRNSPFDNDIPVWFKIWFVLSAVSALSFMGVVIWAIVAIVKHFTV